MQRADVEIPVSIEVADHHVQHVVRLGDVRGGPAGTVAVVEVHVDLVPPREGAEEPLRRGEVDVPVAIEVAGGDAHPGVVALDEVLGPRASVAVVVLPPVDPLDRRGRRRGHVGSARDVEITVAIEVRSDNAADVAVA